jgi:hypothetical protein
MYLPHTSTFTSIAAFTTIFDLFVSNYTASFTISIATRATTSSTGKKAIDPEYWVLV